MATFSRRKHPEDEQQCCDKSGAGLDCGLRLAPQRLICYHHAVQHLMVLQVVGLLRTIVWALNSV
jgi:hypothetical protein